MNLQKLLHGRLQTVRPEDSIDKAIMLMEEHGIRHLPVVRENGTVLGMLSDRDLLESVGGESVSQRRASGNGAATVGPRRVQEIMSVPALSLSPDDPVERAARLMIERGFHAVPIIEEQRIVGIVTGVDLLQCYLSDSNEPRGAWRFERVSDHMHAHVFTLAPDDTLSKALRLMQEKRIRHIPIVQAEQLMGIISDHDLRREIGRARIEWGGARDAGRLNVIRAGDIMTHAVEVVASTATLADAADRMVERKIGALPVVRGDVLVGILSETDLLHVLVAACEA
jgi:CBS domain-containing protein